MIDAGAFREVIEIQKCRYTADAIGNQKPIKEIYYRCRAYVNNLSGAEYWAAAQVQAEATVVFTVRCCRKIRDMDSLGYSVLWNGDEYDITSVVDVMNRHETVKIRATRRKNVKK